MFLFINTIINSGTHQTQGQRLDARIDVVALNTDQREAQLLAQLDGVVAVAQHLQFLLGAHLAEGP